MTNQETAVSQCDRDAAAAFASYAWHLFWPNDYQRAMADAKDMREGRCDNWYLVQSYARHRQQASPGEGVVATDDNGEAMICTGCGTTRTIAAIKASSQTAFSCCPERKMVPVRDVWRASLKPAPDRGAWQDISTAPKDGTVVDLWGQEIGRMTDCYWGRPAHECGEMGQYCDSDWHSDDRESWIDGTFNEPLSDTFLTHWRIVDTPIRALPALAQGEGE